MQKNTKQTNKKPLWTLLRALPQIMEVWKLWKLWLDGTPGYERNRSEWQPHKVFHTAKTTSKNPWDTGRLNLPTLISGNPHSSVFQSLPTCWVVSCRVREKHNFHVSSPSHLSPIPNTAIWWGHKRGVTQTRKILICSSAALTVMLHQHLQYTL